MELRRRDVARLFIAAGGSALFLGSGCNAFPAESGDAYAPWQFPDLETRPEWIAARAAILASNPHNTQPWAMHVTDSLIELHNVPERGPGSIDSLLREQHIGLGCALENLVIAARASGRRAEVTLLPDASKPNLVASIALSPAAPTDEPLFTAIPRRHTNRGRYSDAPLASMVIPALQAQVTDPSVQLHLLITDADKSSFKTNTVAATVAFIADPELSRDSNAWYRHTAAEILEHRDGLTIDATGSPAATRLLGKIFGRPSEASSNSYWLDGTSGPQATASAFCILSSPASNTRADQLLVGRTYQRLALWAVTQGMTTQPINQLAELQDREQTQGLARRFTAVNDGFVTSSRRAQMLFRIGYPWEAALKSPRRPIEWVVT